MGESARPSKAPFWRFIRRLLPSAYRSRWAEDLLQTHVDAVGGSPHSQGFAFWARVTGDVVRTSFSLRADMLMRRRKNDVASNSGRSAAFTMAIRELRRAPGFVLVVAATLGIGITANLTTFSVLDRLLFSPPDHIRDAGAVRRVYVHGTSMFTKELEYSSGLAYPDAAALRGVHAFSDVGIYADRHMTVGRGDDSERGMVELASASYFRTLGVKPELGRFFTEAEDRFGATDRVTVLSHDLWMRRFGGARDAIGRIIAIGKAEYRIIGVAPRGFTGADIAPIDVWIPLFTGGEVEQGTQWEHAFTWYWVGAVARMAPGSTAAAGEAAATIAYRNARAEQQGSDANARVILGSIIAGRGPETSRETVVAKMLGIVALLVLLMTCANAGNLFLARGVNRRRSLAIQTAIGADRASLVQQLMLESLLVACGAGIIAFVLLRLTVPVMFHVLLPDAMPPSVDSLRIAAVTTLFALAAAALAGVITAMRSTRMAPFEALRAGRTTAHSSSIRRMLLAGQAALAVILLLGAALFLRSLRNAASVDLGLSLDTRVVDFEMESGETFAREQMPLIYTAASALQRIPGVQAAAVASLPPFNGTWGLVIDLPGADSIVSGPAGPFFVGAGEKYFEAVGLQITRGRALNASDDRAGARSTVVNESMARALWPDRDPVGQCLLVVKEKDVTPPCTTVVGVVSDYRETIDDRNAWQRYYLPPHHPDLKVSSANYVVVRLRSGAHVADSDLAQAVRAAIPGIRIVQVKTLRSMTAYQLRSWQLGAAVLTIFGIVALIVAGAGLYSVVAFEVAQRRFELGVRSALGATTPRMITALLRDVLRATTLGVMAGLCASLLLGRIAASMLFGVRPTDPVAYAGVCTALIAAGVAAVLWPAWRVTRIDPRTVLNDE